MKEEDVYIECDTGKLAATYVQSPENNSYENKSIIITCHGYGRNRQGSKYIEMSRIASEHGIDSLRLDFYGHGESEGKGKRKKFKDYIGVLNLHSTVDYITGLGYEKKKIGLFGSSTGGKVILQYASEELDIGPLVLRSPVFGNSTLAVAKTIKSPTLVITGTLDHTVSPEFLDTLYKHIGAEKSKEIIEGADHACGNPQHIKELMDLSINWFEMWLK